MTDIGSIKRLLQHLNLMIPPPPPPIHEYYEDIEEITWDKTVNLFLEEFRLEQWDMSLDYMINSHEKFLRAIKGALVFI
jgi:hypothetical protein